MRPLLALGLLALLTASLAGCADDPERYPDGVTPSSTGQTTADGGTTGPATGTSTSTTTGGPSGSANQAPTGSISVVINGTNATFTLGGSDPDGDALVWDLDFGDGNATNGTVLPAMVNHTYAAGNFTANFTVSDGIEPKSFMAPLAVGAGGATGSTQQVVNGEWTAGTPLSCAEAIGGAFEEYPPVNPLEGVEMVRFDVDAATATKAFTLVASLEVPEYGIMELAYYDADGAIIDYFADDGAATIAGEVPAGSSFAVFYPCLAGPGTFLYTAG